ncbi:MAG: helix-turn-helix domain-containing protein [Gammaproteobacteria bacterium]|nr:helix-turn-helix domain-containing protein [Gammaproteobacteria bacterium]
MQTASCEPNRTVQRTLRRSRPGETSVTQAALDRGFWHLGRFSEAYRVRFGELPSETLAGRPVQLRPPKACR